MENYLQQFTELAINYFPKVLGAILTLLIGFWLSGIVSKRIRKNFEKRNIDPSLTPFITSMIGICIKVLVLLSAASMFGLEVTSFVAIFGALALAVGMALQGNLSHFASGIMILFFKPFKVGDFIVTNGYSGTVKETQIFNTLLTTLDNRIIIIPNSNITSNPLENLTANAVRKVPLKFGISYGDDIDKARSVIKNVVKNCPFIDQAQPVDIFVSELADSSVNFVVRPWCKTENFWDVHFYMHEQIKKAFDQAGIGIPFPQMDVYVHKSQEAR